MSISDHSYYANQTSNNLRQAQVEFQGLRIINSHEVTVTQTEAQALVLIQASLQAAIEVAILSIGDGNAECVKKLKNVSQTLEAAQIQAQRIYIEDCDNITVTQTELQLDVAVQAAINLLAQLSLGTIGTADAVEE